MKFSNKLRSIFFYILITYALILTAVVFGSHFSNAKHTSESLQGKTIVQVIDVLGPPENICYQYGLSIPDDPVAFGLQWGIYDETEIMTGHFSRGETTVWFNKEGIAIEVLGDNVED